MASNRIDINVNGKDNTAGAFSSTSNNIKKLGTEAKSAGNTVGSSISSGATKAAGSMRSLASSASSAFSTIRAGAQAASADLGGIGSAIAGLGGAFSALQIGQMAWTGSTQRQFNEMYLGTKMSTAETKKYLDVIAQVVAQVPGDDTWMNSLLTGALAKETSLSADMLTRLGSAASKYVTAAQQTGASILPANAERELTSYIKSGNTGLMIRDGLLKSHVDELNKAKTPSERILALEKAMTEEGYLQLDTASLVSSKWEVIKGQIQLAATNVGSKLLPFVEKVLDFIIDLDEKTNGWTSTIGLVAAAIVGLGLALAPIVGATLSGYYAMKNYRIEAEKAAAANALNKGPGAPVAGPSAVKSKIIDIGWQIAPGLTAAALIGGVKGVLMQAGVGAANILGKAFASTFGAILLPIFYATFEMEGGPWQNFVQGKDMIDWKPLNKLKEDIGGIGAYMEKSRQDIITIWNGISSGIMWAWNGINSFVQNGISSLAGAMRATFNQAAGAVIGAFNWMRGGAQSALNSIVGTYNWARGVVGQGMSSVAHFFASGWQSVIDAYYRVKSIVSQAITTVVNFVTGGGGPAGPGIAGASGPFDGIGLKYENYQGHKKNAWNASGNMSGNCVDMSLGLISAAGTGSLVSGTWNGGAHVWARIGGKDYDPARKALQGTWTPPARGPGGNVGPAVIINGDVYGFDDFQKKVQQANNRIVSGVY